MTIFDHSFMQTWGAITDSAQATKFAKTTIDHIAYF